MPPSKLGYSILNIEVLNKLNRKYDVRIMVYFEVVFTFFLQNKEFKKSLQPNKKALLYLLTYYSGGERIC